MERFEEEAYCVGKIGICLIRQGKYEQAAPYVQRACHMYRIENNKYMVYYYNKIEK